METVLTTISTFLLDHAHKVLLANIKMECQRWPEKPSISGRSGTQYVAMVKSYCKKRQAFLTEISQDHFSPYLIKI